jgi:site-specific DNA recombinase
MVIVHDLSRLSRRVLDTVSFIENFVETNEIKLVSVRERIDTSTPIGKAFINLIAVFSQLYRDEISFRTKASILYKQKNKKFTGGMTPFGYNRIESSKDLITNAAEADVISSILEMRKRGLGYRRIASDLQYRGIPTKTGGTKWYPKVIMQILNRESRCAE